MPNLKLLLLPKKSTGHLAHNSSHVSLKAKRAVGPPSSTLTQSHSYYIRPSTHRAFSVMWSSVEMSHDYTSFEGHA